VLVFVHLLIFYRDEFVGNICFNEQLALELQYERNHFIVICAEKVQNVVSGKIEEGIRTHSFF